MAIALASHSDKDDVTPGTSSQIISEHKKGSAEMIGGCSVCSDDQGTEENPLVYCDGCEVAVHQACYGIILVPSGNWFCRKCESGERIGSKIKCELCPLKDGALKKTENGLWAHVVCALYIPEVRFGNNNTMEPIEIRHILPERYNRTCCICEENKQSSSATYGAVMNCHKSGCKLSFHVTCAQSAGLLFEEGGQGNESVEYCGYCKHHFRKLKAGNSKKPTENNNNTSNLVGSTSPLRDSASDSSQDNDSRCNTSSNSTTNNNTKLNNSSGSSIIKNMNNNNNNNTSNNLITTTTIATTTTASTTTAGTPDKIQSSDSINTSTNNNNSTSNNNKPLILPTTSLSINDANTVSTNTSSPSPNTSNTSSSSSSSSSTSTTSSSSTSSSSSSTSTTMSALTDTSSPSQNNNNKNIPQNSIISNNTYPQPISLTLPQGNSPSLRSSPSVGSSSSTLSSSTPTKINKESPQKRKNAKNNAPPKTDATNNVNNVAPSSLSKDPVSSGPAGDRISSAPDDVYKWSADETNDKDSSNAKATSTTINSSPTLGANSSATTTTTNLNNNNRKQTQVISPSSTSPKTSSSNSILNSQPTNHQVNSSSSTTTSSQLSKLAANLLTPTSSTLTATTDSIKEQQKQSANPTNVTPTTASTATTNAAAPATTATTCNPIAITTPKPKVGRGRKNATATTQNNNTSNMADTSTPVKPPPAKRSKPRASKKIEAEPVAVPPTGKAQPPSVQNVVGGPSMPSALPASTPKAGTKRKAKNANLDQQQSNDQSGVSVASTPTVAPSPTKRARKKKGEEPTPVGPVTGGVAPPGQKLIMNQPADPRLPLMSNQMPMSGLPNSHHLLSTTSAGSSAPTSSFGPLMINTPLGINSNNMNMILNSNGLVANNLHQTGVNTINNANANNNLTTSTNNTMQLHADDAGRAFEELRENVWTHVYKFVLEHAQQFDTPQLLGTLYNLRKENEALELKVRDLNIKRNQLVAMNARLDLPGPLLTQHLNQTSPNYSIVMNTLAANSPKSISGQQLPPPSPGSSIGKTGSLVGPLGSVSSYNQYPSNLLPQPQTSHSSAMNNIKSCISTPSPPIGALMAHGAVGAGNRPGLITINTQYMPNAYQSQAPPPAVSSMSQLGGSQAPPYYHRQ